MNIELHEIPVREIIAGYIDDAENGVRGYNGRLNIRPAFQREFIYKDKQRDEVIYTVRKNFPLNVMYWVKSDGGNFEVLDGQQRTISICQYVTNCFSVMIDGMPRSFNNLTEEEQNQILDYPLMIYICEGTNREKLDWFKIINIAGEELTDQELRNAVYTGEWLTDAKRHFSRTQCPAYQIGSDYLNGTAIRQDYLETVIKWIATRDSMEIENYMAQHQHDVNSNELWLYFQSVINWINTTFPVYHREMKGLDWGRLYEAYHNNAYNNINIPAKVQELYEDYAVENKKGIFEYVLGGCVHPNLLNIRLFDKSMKATAYNQQTAEAQKNGVSNCPLCAVGHDNNRNRIYQLNEMDADHVTAWSNGGVTDIDNCQMLCITHNRAKGNR